MTAIYFLGSVNTSDVIVFNAKWINYFFHKMLIIYQLKLLTVKNQPPSLGPFWPSQ